MDRRTVLAFVLIFLVFTGYSWVMKTYFPPEIDPAAADSTALALDSGIATDMAPVTTATDSGTSPADFSEPTAEAPTGQVPLTAAEALRQEAPGEESRVLVRSPLYELAIGTRGGRIVSWQGMNYDSFTGGQVQLIPESYPAQGEDRLIFRGAELDLSGLVYSPETQVVEVREGAGAVSLTLEATLRGGLVVRKIFAFRPDAYGIEVDYVLATGDSRSGAALDLTGSPEDFRFAWNQGIAPTERNQKMEQTAMRSLARIGDEYHYKKRNGLEKDAEKVTEQWRGSVKFAGLQNKYFTVIGIVPQEQGEPVEGRIRVSGDTGTLAQSWAIDVPARRGAGEEIAVGRLEYFIGPQETELLRAYDIGLEDTMDLGWKLFRPLAKIVLVVMNFMHRYIANYGVIILILSVITKLMFYPLTKSSTESMKKMQELQPKLKALQEKHKKDKDKLNQATMKLYQEEKVNPLAGCLPLLVQSPVFIALYQGLNHTIALRGQPFTLWITDLSQPDAIATLPFALPFLGSDLNVLPILMSGAMYFQTKFTPTGGAGGQMAMMNTLLPLFMIFIFYNMPSGLVLYWLVNTLMQGYQSWRIHSKASAGGGTQTT